VIAHEGQGLGGHTFVSFDRQALALLQQRFIAAELLGETGSVIAELSSWAIFPIQLAALKPRF